MTKQELLKILHNARNVKDQETGHTTADYALLDFINDEKITKAYEEIKKYYS